MRTTAREKPSASQLEKQRRQKDQENQPLAEARGRTQKAVVIQPGADVAVRGGHKALLPQHPAHLDYFLAQLLLRLAEGGFGGGLVADECGHMVCGV